MFHKPASKGGKDFAASYKMRLGAWLFLLYALIYAVFVAVNVISPISMEKTIIFGLNLAVVYGFGLIIFALILALIYNSICASKEKKSNTSMERDK